MKLIGFIVAILISSLISHLYSQDNLSSYWSFDEALEGDFISRTDDGIHEMKFIGSLIPGVIGNAMSFDGNGDYALICSEERESISIIGETGSSSISLWFKVDHVPENCIAPILYCSFDEIPVEEDVARKGFYIEIGHSPNVRKDGKVHFTAWNRDYYDPDLCYHTKHPLSEGEWHHVVAVMGPDYNTGYLNGIELLNRKYNFGDSQTSQLFKDLSGHEDLYLGKGYWRGATQYLNGAIDELRIYTKALSADEVKALYEMR